MANVSLGLLARVEAKPGKEAEVESFLRSALSIVEEEPETLEWCHQAGTINLRHLRRV
jgi:hypothetical protein